MPQKIKIRRGLKSDIPSLEIGEFGFCTDTKELFVGADSGNLLINYNNDSLSSLNDVDLTSLAPFNSDVLTFENGKWKSIAPSNRISKTTVNFLQSQQNIKDGQIVSVQGFYAVGDKCVGGYLVKVQDGLEVWGTPFTTDGIVLTLSNKGELKAGTSYKLVPLSENGSVNLRLLGLSEKGTVDNAPIFNVGMNAFSDVTINGKFNTRPIYITKANATYRGSITLNQFEANQEYIIKVKARSVKFFGELRLFGGRTCKNGFIGEDWAGSYIQDIHLDSFTRWGMIGLFTPGGNSNGIQIGHSQTNLCGSYLDTTFTTLNYDTSDNAGISTLSLVNPIPSDINVNYLYSIFTRINQKQIGSIVAGSNVLTVVDKSGIRKTETLTITGLNDSNGQLIKFKVIKISGNDITLDQTASQTVSNVDVFLHSHYLPIYDITGSWDMGQSIVDSNTIKIHSTANKEMGANAQGKIRIIIGGGIHIEPGNDNNIWDFGTCHNIANLGIALMQSGFYGVSFQRFEASVNEIGYGSISVSYANTFGTAYFEGNGENFVIAGTTSFSIYEPVMAESKIYMSYEKQPDTMYRNASIINTGVLYNNSHEYISYVWANGSQKFIGGKTYIIDYSRPSTDNQTFVLSSLTNLPSGNVVKIIICDPYKSTITFKSEDPAYTISGASTYVDLSGCEVFAFKDNVTFTWKIFINKTSFVTAPTGDVTAPSVTVSPTDGSTFSTETQKVILRPNESSTIYYTLDGTTPTTSSKVYDDQITISNTTTIKYFAKDLAGNSSSVSSATITEI